MKKPILTISSALLLTAIVGGSALSSAEAHERNHHKGQRLDQRLERAERNGAWAQCSPMDRLEDRIDRREDRRDRRHNNGPLDRLEDRLDHAENHRDRNARCGRR